MKNRFFVIFVALVILLVTVVPVSALQDADVVSTDKATVGLLFDGADLLSQTQEDALRSKLDTYSNKHNVDFVIATVDTLGGYPIEIFAGNYYDEGGFGRGGAKDGVLLVIAMSEREWYILTNGSAHTAITDLEVDNIGNRISSYLTSGDYSQAFTLFADECEYEINGELNGFPFKLGRNLLIAVAIGLVIAFIVTGIWRAQLKSVRLQSNATTYKKSGSMQVDLSRDLYLYSTVARRAKPQNNSSSRSGGGSSRGGGGGSF